MKKFILKCMLFIALLAAVDYLSGYLFLLHNKAEVGKVSKARHLASDFSEDILILGSSRASRHFNSNLISELTGMTCFNGGFDAHGIINAYPLFNMAVKHHVPKIVIYDLTPPLDCYDNNNSQYTAFLRPYHDSPIVKEVIRSVSQLEFLKFHSNLYCLNSQVPQLILLPLIPAAPHINGYQPLFGEIYNAANGYAREGEEFEPDSVKLKYLDRLVKDCRDLGIDLYFFVSPIFNNETNLYQIPDFLSQRYDVPVLDHLQDSGFTWNKKYFYDMPHLNCIGADTLSGILVKEIRR